MKVNQCFESDMADSNHTDTHSYHYPALQLLSFYNWAELILQRMDQNLFWEEIKVVLGTIIQEKLGKADTAHGKGALITLAGLQITGFTFFHEKPGLLFPHINLLQLSRRTLTEVFKAHPQSTHQIIGQWSPACSA